jgi:chromosome segregation ATPase
MQTINTWNVTNISQTTNANVSQIANAMPSNGAPGEMEAYIQSVEERFNAAMQQQRTQHVDDIRLLVEKYTCQKIELLRERDAIQAEKDELEEENEGRSELDDQRSEFERDKEEWEQEKAEYEQAKTSSLERKVSRMEARATAANREHVKTSADHVYWQRQYRAALAERNEWLQRYAVCTLDLRLNCYLCDPRSHLLRCRPRL